MNKVKLFTILITLFYIFGVISYFYHFEIFASFTVFVVLLLLIKFLDLDFKKSLILYFIFFAGLIRALNSFNLADELDNLISNFATIKGQIISHSDVSIKNQKTKFLFRADSANINQEKYNDVNTKFLVSIDNEIIDEKFEIGDYVEFSGKLRTPNPSSNPYQFDYEKYLLNKDVKNILYVDSYKKLKSVDKADKWYYALNKFEKIRNKIIETHAKNIKSPNLEILGGIVFGSETINPDEEIKENFKNSGLLHLLAASGLNVALIYGIWWWIASLIRFPYNLSILTGAICVILYTFMTGFPPSILRASIMLLFVLFGKIIDRNANSLALIFFVGFLMLLISPKMIFDIGFQLSFIVTIGLVVCVPVIISKFDNLDKKFKEKYKNSSRFKKYLIFLFSPSALASVVAVPLVAQLFVIPLQMHYFNNFAPFSLLANIAVVPFIGVLSFLGFVSSILALIPGFDGIIIKIFDFIANIFLTLLVKISEFFASFKISLISTYALNIFQIFDFWIIVLFLTLNLKTNFKNKKHLILLLVSILLFFLSFIKIENFKNELEIMMFDVENADSFLIKTPKNKYIMIDTGKKSYKGTSSAQLIINKYLKNKRINSLEVLIITHFDMDHCAGTIDILKENKVKQVIIQKDEAKSLISDEILNYLKNNKINYKIAKNDEIVYQEKDLTFKTYVPLVENNKNIDNEASIVTLLNYKNKNVLFMADSGHVGYENIKTFLPNKIDILKIGHHGAKGSITDEMIKELKPDYALISVGFNKFNHPHFSTIEILDRNNIKTISTKNFGFSKIILKNDDEKIYHFNIEIKKLQTLKFIEKPKIPFHKNEFFQKFIQKNLN